MTRVTEATEVFAATADDPRCAVLFLARRQPRAWRGAGTVVVALDEVMQQLGAGGWRLSLRGMLDDDDANVPVAYDTGFSHGIDLAGVFEAPSITAALAGTLRLERAGWTRLFATEWLLGPREFAGVKGAPSPSDPPGDGRDWGFIALWEWNDAWEGASRQTRREYDAECDEAFAADLALGIDIGGRHRLDWASRWHHLGVWEAASPQIIDSAMREHERVADFRFTTSRHYLGLRRPLAELLRAGDV